MNLNLVSTSRTYKTQETKKTFCKTSNKRVDEPKFGLFNESLRIFFALHSMNLCGGFVENRHL
jgi:hypothetical protein